MSYIPEETIYLCLAHMSEEGIEQKYVKEAFDTNWVVPLGPNVNAFENDLKNFVGGENEVVALSAGTAAVHLALIGCGVQPGDEVLVIALQKPVKSLRLLCLWLFMVCLMIASASWKLPIVMIFLW